MGNGQCDVGRTPELNFTPWTPPVKKVRVAGPSLMVSMHGERAWMDHGMVAYSFDISPRSLFKALSIGTNCLHSYVVMTSPVSLL